MRRRVISWRLYRTRRQNEGGAFAESRTGHSGACRVFLHGKGSTFYEANPFFWTKLATFGVIGLISIAPTARFLAWARKT
ncbi:MAG: DUF2214 family protein [Brevundimonas sp.]